MTTVYLYGALGRKFGSRWTLDVKSPAEAVRAIMANRPDFRTYMIQRSTPGYHVLIGNDAIGGAERLHDPSGRHCIKIIPAIAGAKGGGIGQIILGVILVAVVVASFYIDPTGTLALTLSSGGLTPLGYAAVGVGMMGASMIVSGVTTLLTGTPSGPSFDTQERPENKPSFLFNGPVNTSAQGHPVSIGYGRLRVGSAVISAGIATEDIA